MKDKEIDPLIKRDKEIDTIDKEKEREELYRRGVPQTWDIYRNPSVCHYASIFVCQRVSKIC